MIDCNSLAAKCELPIRFDNYKGCSHNCAYCFVRRYNDIDKIADMNCVKELRNFINGSRNVNTNWCDWEIPLHWGGVSDPFQKLERAKRISYKCLEVFAETKYPFVVSTKGTVIADPEYLDLLRQCNAVVQVSMISPKYDRLERGAPPYSERLKMLPQLAMNTKRLIVRYQPYMREVLHDAIEGLKALKDSGVHGIILEGLVAGKPRPGMFPIGAGRYIYDYALVEPEYRMIKDECHKLGLVFNCGDDAFRDLGDSSCCCGVDGLKGFKPNRFNALNIANGIKASPTEKMKEVGTARCFRIRNAENEKRLKKSSFYLETLRVARSLL